MKNVITLRIAYSAFLLTVLAFNFRNTTPSFIFACFAVSIVLIFLWISIENFKYVEKEFKKIYTEQRHSGFKKTDISSPGTVFDDGSIILFLVGVSIIFYSVYGTGEKGIITFIVLFTIFCFLAYYCNPERQHSYEVKYYFLFGSDFKKFASPRLTETLNKNPGFVLDTKIFPYIKSKEEDIPEEMTVNIISAYMAEEGKNVFKDLERYEKKQAKSQEDVERRKRIQQQVKERLV